MYSVNRPSYWIWVWPFMFKLSSRHLTKTGWIKVITLSNYPLMLIAKHKHQTNEMLKLINNSPKPVQNWVQFKSMLSPAFAALFSLVNDQTDQWQAVLHAERFFPHECIAQFRISFKRKLNVLSIKSKNDGGKMNTNGPDFSLKYCFYRKIKYFEENSSKLTIIQKLLQWSVWWH